PGRSTGPFTAIRWISTIGDPIGRGLEYSLAGGDGTFTGTDLNNQYSMDLTFLSWSYFANPPTDESGRLYLKLEGSMAVLVPGVYVDTIPDEGRPNIIAGVATNFPYYTTGSFVIKEILPDPNGKLEHF